MFLLCVSFNQCSGVLLFQNAVWLFLYTHMYISFLINTHFIYRSLGEIAISFSVSHPQEHKPQPFPGVTLKPVGQGWLQLILSLLKKQRGVFFVCYFQQPWLSFSSSVALTKAARILFCVSGHS